MCLKFDRIPKKIMHKLPTTLLHSLEGMEGLDWDKLLKLQSKDGSFLFSPSSTAYAFMQTKDEKCLDYLNNVVERFNGGGIIRIEAWTFGFLYLILDLQTDDIVFHSSQCLSGRFVRAYLGR